MLTRSIASQRSYLLTACAITLMVSFARCWAAPATYFVDYEQGSDSHPGTDPDHPFKHAPGDPEATGKLKGLALHGGARVVFKGGVYYRGTIEIRSSGTEGDPIVYDGNTEGTFGEGRAVLDGSVTLTGWKQCASAQDCGGNRHWQSIYYTHVPGGKAWAAGLLQNDRTLGLAQYPDSQDYDYVDSVREFESGPESGFTKTSIAHPIFSTIGGEDLLGAYVQVYCAGNLIRVRKMTGYDQESSQVSFAALDRPPYRRTEGRFAIVNSIHDTVLSRPGEYVFVETPNSKGACPVFLWPLDGQDPNQVPVTLSKRTIAFTLGKETQHVTIRGFTIQKYHQAISNSYRGWDASEAPASGLTIQNNVITRIRQEEYGTAVHLVNTVDPLVADNHLSLNARQRGISIHTSLRPTVRNNTIHKVGQSPIILYYAISGTVQGNRISDSVGRHSNGIGVHVGSKDMVVEGNVVWNSHVPLAVNKNTNITIRNNVFDGSNGYPPIALWSGGEGNMLIENNVLIRSGRKQTAVSMGGVGDSAGIVFDYRITLRNNIMDGPIFNLKTGTVVTTDVTVSGNTYQHVRPNYVLGQGERVVEDLDTLLVDVDSHNYTRK